MVKNTVYGFSQEENNEIFYLYKNVIQLAMC